jgi:16S rRNA (cytosine967-C5)-methyltransferase
MDPRTPVSAQLAAARALASVIGGRSLLTTVKENIDDLGDPDTRGLTRELCYGTVRWLPQIECVVTALVHKPIRAKDLDVRALVYVGLYQLMHTTIPSHVAVDATVSACRDIGKSWAAAFVNGVLRNFQRRRDELPSRLAGFGSYVHAHPEWMLGHFRAAWPDRWQSICAANNRRPPMTLRINRGITSVPAYLHELNRVGIEAHASGHAPEAITLTKPMNVESLPGFTSGEVSVQDEAAQLAAHLMDLSPGQQVLDACAAPGGKTAHILELQPDIDRLIAVDISEDRMRLLESNLTRLKLNAKMIVADATMPGRWWDGVAFERILIDAPCTGTGVIRRQPDIKLHRRPDDIAGFVTTQASLLRALWPLLAPGGKLLYATCSIVPPENDRQLDAFIEGHPDADSCAITGKVMPAASGRLQILPGEHGMDGFFYGLLAKR